MKSMKKRVVTSIMACFIACFMFALPVLAASSSFSKSTPKLNALDGGASATRTFSSGSVLGNNPAITEVRVFLNVASGTDPYDFYLQSPKGRLVSFTPSTSSKTYYLKDFNGEDPSGTWKVFIVNAGYSYNPNQIIPASTVTPTITVSYSY